MPHTTRSQHSYVHRTNASRPLSLLPCGPVVLSVVSGLLQAWRPDILTFEHAGKRPFRQSLPLANQNVTCVEFTLSASPSGLADNAPGEGKMQEAVQAANELAAAVRMEPRLYVFNAHFNVLGESVGAHTCVSDAHRWDCRQLVRGWAWAARQARSGVARTCQC